ncbi:MAG: F0F1 ATP synthase subunit delta [Eubacteriales bacterium]
MEGLLISAFKLDKDTIKQLEEKFSEKVGEQVKLKLVVDPSLIGGFIVSIRHHRYDYSIKNSLKEMKDYMVEI